MNEEKLNISTRKFLKNVGVNSQRIIETEIRKSVESKKISSNKKIKVSVNLSIDELSVTEKIEGEIDIEI
ncbi:MAG: hypothetical protein CBE14_001675 [Rickettsiales bacterium TMED254]|nr:hypothetical protein [Rickettsiales bacterium]RPF76887.1 MAG: hypothetical protein CBE14_001675 [Rickettsiales bacterium TMED254]|tara:strand:+ start:292 stop:501 length:210 start_codon:yes stop_codon:yes gene_type:complete